MAKNDSWNENTGRLFHRMSKFHKLKGAECVKFDLIAFIYEYIDVKIGLVTNPMQISIQLECVPRKTGVWLWCVNDDT